MPTFEFGVSVLSIYINGTTIFKCFRSVNDDHKDLTRISKVVLIGYCSIRELAL